MPVQVLRTNERTLSLPLMTLFRYANLSSYSYAFIRGLTLNLLAPAAAHLLRSWVRIWVRLFESPCITYNKFQNEFWQVLYHFERKWNSFFTYPNISKEAFSDSSVKRRNSYISCSYLNFWISYLYPYKKKKNASYGNVLLFFVWGQYENVSACGLAFIKHEAFRLPYGSSNV